MVLCICTRYVVVEYSAVDPYWGRCCKSIQVYIPTGDVKKKYGNVDPYWGRRTLWLTMVLCICTRYVVVECSAVDPYWGRCCRKVYKCISLLETLR